MADLVSEIVGKEAFEQVEHLTNLLLKATKVLEDFIKTGKKAADDMAGSKGFQQTAESAEKVADKIEEATEAQNQHRIATAALNSLLKEYAGTVEQNIRQSISFKLQLAQLKDEKAKLDQQFLNKNLEGYKSKLIEITQAEQQLKQGLAEVTQTIKTQIKEINAAEGSYDQLNQRLGLLRNTYRQLSETEREGKIGQALLADISVLDARLKAIDASMGNHQRNVGNYKSHWDGLGNSIQQVAREFPAFANDFRTGMMGISNNLPILIDEITRLRNANKALAAEGKPVTSVFKQIGWSIMSFNTLLSVGITLLVVYGKEIAEWAKGLGRSRKEIDTTTKAKREFNKAVTEGAASERAAALVSYRAATNVKLGYEARLAASKKLKDEYPIIFQNLSNEAIMAGKAADAYNELSNAIIAKAAVNVLQGEIEKLIKYQEAVRNNAEEINKLAEANKTLNPSAVNDFVDEGLLGGKSASELAVENTQKAIDTLIGRIAEYQEKYSAMFGSKSDTTKVRDNSKAILKSEQDLTRELYAEMQKRKSLEADTQKEIADDEQFSLDERLLAHAKYIEAKISAVGYGLSAEYDVNEIAIGKIKEIERKSAEERTEAEKNLLLQKETLLQRQQNLELDFTNKVSAISREGAKESLAIIKKQSDEETRYRIESLEKITLNNELQQQKELDALTENLSKRKISVEQYEREVEAIRGKYSKKSLDDTIDYLEELLDNEELSGGERIELQKRVDEARLRSAEMTNQKMLDSQKKLSQAYKQLGQELFSSIVSITNSSYDKRIQQSDRSIEKIEQEKQAELNRIDQTAKSEDEARKLKAVAEAKYNVEQQKIENQRRVTLRRQASFNKAADIAEIGTRTALAVVTTLSDKTITPGYLRIPLAVATGAIGAAQLARAIATPLPQYYKGVESSPETWAWVGERGTEGRVNPDGSFELTPDKPSLTYLQKGTKIIPHEELMGMAVSYSVNAVSTQPSGDSKMLHKILFATQQSSQEIVRAIKDGRQGDINIKITSSDSWKQYEYKYYKK